MGISPLPPTFFSSEFLPSQPRPFPPLADKQALQRSTVPIRRRNGIRSVSSCTDILRSANLSAAEMEAVASISSQVGGANLQPLMLVPYRKREGCMLAGFMGNLCSPPPPPPHIPQASCLSRGNRRRGPGQRRRLASPAGKPTPALTARRLSGAAPPGRPLS